MFFICFQTLTLSAFSGNTTFEPGISLRYIGATSPKVNMWQIMPSTCVPLSQPTVSKRKRSNVIGGAVTTMKFASLCS